MSIITGKSIAAELARTLPVTLTLAALALAFAMIVGVISGLIAGHFKDTWVDHAGRFGALLLLSVPGFWLAIVLILVFSEHLRWLPTSGWTDWKSVILPTFVLGAGTAAIMSRMTRAYTISNLVEPYVIAARGRGLPSGVIAGDFVLRNMLVPLIGLAGTYLGGILSGTVIVEYIFAIPGAGRFAYESVLRRDYTAIQSYVALISLAYVGIGILTDLAVQFVDPRVRLEVTR
ncbi:ABC transporter permease [Hyphomicrobium sulfonivorans]|uniref:ABC transporter permease n=1 Tax=Hyphomicrobium sulfonivorans TaxID=121290 RepID=UPI0018DE1876|nr:ABC transporter permease [Hyphomicrobium sulfonivorans]